jgi:hypothetical protein
MTITLRPEHEKLVIRAMQTGAYGNRDDYWKGIGNTERRG